jgi:ligand-binding sensor domain-containing protein/signal transduction histidine kinase
MLPWIFAWLAMAPAAKAPAPVAAGQYIARAWGTADGLPQNSVTAIVQTRDGYLWFGTFGGLVRFDGHAFTVFDPDNSPGLASARVISLHEDAERVLWIGTESGLSRYERGRFTSYDGKDGLAGGVLAALRDSRGRLWLGAGPTLTRLEAGRFVVVPTPANINVVAALAETADGSVWAATPQGVVRFSGSDAPTLLPVPGPSRIARSLLVDRQGTLWAGADGLSRWDGSRFVDVPLPIAWRTRGSVASMSEGPDGALWIGTTSGGVFRVHHGTADAFDTAAGLSDNAVRAVLADADGNLWVGTEIGGLNRVKRRHVFSYQRTGVQSIGPIVGDGAGGLWIGATCGGLLHFDGSTLRTNLLSDTNLSCIWALHRDPDGALWVGSTLGLARVDRGRVTTFPRDQYGLLSDMILGLARDRQGVLWIGSPQGLTRWDGTSFVNYAAAQGLTHDVHCILEDRHGALWVGGTGGLSKFEHGTFTRITTAQGLSHDHVRAIYEDADGVLWIGTYGGGLNRLQDGKFTVYGIKEGLPDSAVSRIIEDARGNLWMSGNKGVYRVARAQLNDFADGKVSYITAVTYGEADGMAIDETNGGQPAGWQSEDGRLWFPTIKGLVGIDPVTTMPKPPPVYIERAVVGGRSIDPRDLPRLGPGAVDAEFHYTAVDLGAAEKTRFRYRLAGHDEAWIDVGTRRVAYYTSIPPGTYTFEVIATDSEGMWTTSPAGLRVVVVPFWWQRREAIAAALVALLGVTAAVARGVTLRRARARVAEFERERALERERTRIARDLHDDLGTRLSHISILAATGAVTGRDERISREALAAVETMDELVWAVNARNDTIESFANYIAHFAEDHVNAAGLRCRLLLPPDPPARPLGADVRRHLYLAVKEAINNALKHARAAEIRVELRVEPRSLVVEVADDGRGLPADLDPTGNGLENFRARMEATGGTVEVVTRPGAGTRLVFTVPLAGA